MLGADVGKKSLINYRSDITFKKNVSLDSSSIIYKNASIYINKGGKFRMGSFSHCAPNAYFLIEKNRIEIGNDVAIGPYCSFFCSSNHHKGENSLFRNNYINGNISIGNNVFIGAHTVVLPGTSIGNDIVIAANSVVKGKLENGYLYGGTPCKKIKKLKE